MAMFRHRKGFGMVRAFFGVSGGYRNPEEVYGPYWALTEERGKKQRRCPPKPNPNWEGPPFLLNTSSFPPSPTPTRKGGVLLPVGVGLPPWRALPGRPPLPPCSFIYGGRGAPLDTQVDLLISLSRVRCPPPPYSTSVISSRSLGEALRR